MAASTEADSRFRVTVHGPGTVSRAPNAPGQKRGTASEDSGRVDKDGETPVVPSKRSKEEVIDE